MVQTDTQRTDPGNSLPAGKSGMITQTRNALRAVMILLVGHISVHAFFIYLAFETRAWQLFVVVGLILLIEVITLAGIRLIRRGRSELGIELSLGVWLMSLIGISVMVAGLGLLFAVAAVALVSTIAGQTLPQKSAGRAIIASVVVGAVTLLLDLYVSPIYRFQLAVPVTFLWVVVGAVALVYIVFIARQFTNYSLRTKLIIAFLVVSVLSAGTLAFLSNRTTNAALEAQVGANLQSLANLQAVTISDLLIRQVELLQTIAATRLLEFRLEVVNAEYEGDSATILAQLQEFDEQWSTASDSDLLVRSRLDAVSAREFRNFRANFPDHVEIFVTDRYGGLVAATNRTSDYYQADEEWWQTAFNEGQGAIYIGQPEFDASSGTFAINMAVPVYDAADTETVVGVLRSTYRAGALLDLLGSVQVGQTGHTDLYLSEEHTLAEGDTGLVPADPDTLSQLQASADLLYARLTYEGRPSLVSQAPVRAITEEPAISNLDWTLIVHQDEQEALAAVEAQTRAGLLLVLLIVGLAAAAAIGLAQLLAGPITRLTAAAGQVASGDLSVRARVESGDEIGTLASAFNTMTGQLQETVDTLEERVADRTQRLETVVDVSQRLTGILDLSDLLRQVVTLTKEVFNYYHAHIYLLEGDTLIMAEGYGQPGLEMKRRGHSISLAAPQSLVARTAREGRVITVENVRDDPTWLPNPLLPDTHSEMAVPVMLGPEVVGVLDVQSEKVGGLTPEDETTLQALANQVAVVVRNARSFAQTQEALYEAQRLQRLYTGQAWEKFGASRPTTDYEVRQPALPPLEQITTPEVAAALQQEQTVTLISGGQQAQSESRRSTAQKPIEDIQPEPRSSKPETHGQLALATPLKLRDEIVGVLGIQDENPDRQWTEDEIALIEAVSEQMSLAIDNARLFEETGRRASREKVIADLTSQLWASGELEQVMQTAVQRLGTTLDASKVVIRLGTEDQLLPSPPSVDAEKVGRS